MARSTRLTRTDIETINTALALLEADVEAEEPDLYGSPAGRTRKQWATALARVRSVRDKVQARRRK